MINDELLLENGYKKYDDIFRIADYLFQKRIRDDKGTKYFIDIYKYDSEYEIVLRSEKEKYALHFRMYATGNRMSLKDIEEEIETIWNELGCNYYEIGEV